uniref:Uncharacterized protein n=1 Tax=viral metagenome TaxID=1070528 RepID=A0A6C0LQU3_9ZZZZ
MNLIKLRLCPGTKVKDGLSYLSLYEDCYVWLYPGFYITPKNQSIESVYQVTDEFGSTYDHYYNDINIDPTAIILPGLTIENLENSIQISNIYEKPSYFRKMNLPIKFSAFIQPGTILKQLNSSHHIVMMSECKFDIILSQNLN